MWTDNADHDRDRDDGHSCHDYVGLAQARPNKFAVHEMLSTRMIVTRKISYAKIS